MRKTPAMFENVALCARSASRTLMLHFSRVLKEKYQCKVHLYCYGRQEFAYYKKEASEFYDTLTDAALLHVRCFDSGLNHTDVVARAKRLEALLRAPLNHLIMPERHFGRAFALGGFFHPRSRQSELPNWTQVLHAMASTLEFWEREFREKAIDLVLDGSREASRMAEAMAIPARILVGSRYKNYHYWAWNDLYESPLIERAYRKRSKVVRELEADKPYHAHLAARKTYKNAFSARTAAFLMGYEIARYAYWHLKGYEKAKGYYCLENVKYHYRVWSHWKQLNRLPLLRLKDLEGVRFVYFPLHVEPETALHGISPEFFDQLGLVASIARDLPADSILAVKEPYGMVGRRPDHFYKQLSDFKNVRLLHPWEIGIQCAQSAAAVVTICGTAGLEGILAGRPVVTVGQHNIYNCATGVYRLDSTFDLCPALSWALERSVPDRDIMQDAQLLLNAVLDCSFDLGTYDYISLNSFDPSIFADMLTALETSLAAPQQSAVETAV